MHSSLVYVILVLSLVICVQIRSGNGESEYASSYNYNIKPYGYSYAVSDPLTGDHKSQWESRENGVVRGSYSLLEPDGTTRIVDYTADETGFHPVVRKINTPSQDNPTYSNSYRPGYSYQSNYNRPAYSYSSRTYDDYRRNTNRDLDYPRRANYNNDYYNHGNAYGSYNQRYSGRRYDEYNPGRTSTSQRIGLGEQRQPIPLLHAAYHGYNNLYN